MLHDASPQWWRPVPRKSYARIRDVYELPRLIEVQLDSFRWFQTEGLEELFERDFAHCQLQQESGAALRLEAMGDREGRGFWFGEPKYSEPECRDRDMTFAAPLWVRVKLVNRETGEVSRAERLHGRFPADDRERHLHY